jgi:3-oxo-5-alpha-steroid 4-dehydrogenase 1
MEIVSPIFLWWQLGQVYPQLPIPVFILAGWWGLHYFNRSLIFPLRIRTRGKRIPVLIVLFAFSFNIVNGSLNGHYLAHHLNEYSNQLFTHPRFWIGTSLLLIGAGINIWSDEKLLRLRKPEKLAIRFPRGDYSAGFPAPTIWERS